MFVCCFFVVFCWGGGLIFVLGEGVNRNSHLKGVPVQKWCRFKGVSMLNTVKLFTLFQTEKNLIISKNKCIQKKITSLYLINVMY